MIVNVSENLFGFVANQDLEKFAEISTKDWIKFFSRVQEWQELFK